VARQDWRETPSEMIACAQLAAEIIERVRSLYRRETQQQELVDSNEIIGQMVVLLNDRASRHSISIRTELDSELPHITADCVQLRHRSISC
jgi:signal transduction histidine kinase